MFFLKNPEQFARIHTSSLINIEKILNRPITKFYKSDDVTGIAGELRLPKLRPTSFYKKHNLSSETMPTDVNKYLKTNVKNRSVCMGNCKLRKNSSISRARYVIVPAYD